MSIVLAFLAGAASISAVEVTPDNRNVIIINSSDLDLDRPADLRRFRLRIQTAVGRVCAVPGRTMAETNWSRACREEALSGARLRVNDLIAAARRNSAIQLGAR